MGTKFYSLTQCSLTVNECDWHILATMTRELIHVVWLYISRFKGLTSNFKNSHNSTFTELRWNHIWAYFCWISCINSVEHLLFFFYKNGKFLQSWFFALIKLHCWHPYTLPPYMFVMKGGNIFNSDVFVHYLSQAGFVILGLIFTACKQTLGKVLFSQLCVIVFMGKGGLCLRASWVSGDW